MHRTIRSTSWVTLVALSVAGWLVLNEATGAELIDLASVKVTRESNPDIALARLGADRLKQVDAILIEIPPGGQLPAGRHLAEEIIYIVSCFHPVSIPGISTAMRQTVNLRATLRFRHVR